MKAKDRRLTKKTYRNQVLQYAVSQYGTEAEYLWAKFPGYAVLRHEDNRKWYAVIMDVRREKLGLPGDGYVDILEVKCDPATGGSFLSQKGILPAYHMHRGDWLTVLLDGSVKEDMIFLLLDMSFDITADRKSSRKARHSGSKDWVVPANPKYFDLEKAFAESETILWKQSTNVAAGDIVYLYVAAPVSSIRYKCKAVEVDIPYQYDNGEVRMSRVMRIQLLHRFQNGQLDLNSLKEHGISSVRGPRNVPNSLRSEINTLIGIS